MKLLSKYLSRITRGTVVPAALALLVALAPPAHAQIGGVSSASTPIVQVDASADEAWPGDGGGPGKDQSGGLGMICWTFFFLFGIPQFPLP